MPDLAKAIAESRKNRRPRVLKDGKIVLPGGWITYGCVIRDLTGQGARLRLASAALQLPAEFALIVIADCLSYPATLRWRRGAEIGVEFSGAPKQVAARLW